MAGYGLQFQVITASQALREPVTKALLAKFGGLSVTGYYDLASRWVVTIRELIVQANQVLIPAISHLRERDPRSIPLVYRESYRLVFCLGRAGVYRAHHSRPAGFTRVDRPQRAPVRRVRGHPRPGMARQRACQPGVRCRPGHGSAAMDSRGMRRHGRAEGTPRLAGLPVFTSAPRPSLPLQGLARRWLSNGHRVVSAVRSGAFRLPCSSTESGARPRRLRLRITSLLCAFDPRERQTRSRPRAWRRPPPPSSSPPS